MKGNIPWKEVKGQIFLGSDDFTAQFKGLLRGKVGIKEIPRIQRYAARPPLTKLLQKKDQGIIDEAIYRAHVGYGYPLKDIAEYVGVHYTMISRTIKRVEKRGMIK